MGINAIEYSKNVAIISNHSHVAVQLQRENVNLVNKLKSLQRENARLKSLLREKANCISLADMQEQLDDVTRVRDRLRIEFSDVRSQLKAAQHDNGLLITQYDNLSEKYSALAIEVNNNRERLHESGSSKQYNDVERKSKKKKKKKKSISDDQIWRIPTPEEELQQREYEKQRKRDIIAQLDIELLQEQTRKKLYGK